MTSRWPEMRVADLERRGVLLAQDGNHGEYRPRRDEIVAVGTPHIRAADISDDGAIDFPGAQQIDDVALARIRKGVGARGDVLLTHKGTVGRIARVPADAPHFVCSPQTTFWRSLDEDVLDQDFLFAYMRTPHFASQLRACMNETDMAPYVSLTAQRALKVLLPPIATQREIAAVVRTLDEKLDSNRRVLALLETGIRTLFVRHVVEEQDGGWTTGNLLTLARFVNGRAFTKDASGTGARPVLRIKELNTGISDATLNSDADAGDDNIARHHDLLFSWSGSLEVYRWHGPESLINQHIFKVLPHDGFPIWLVAGWIRHHLPEFQRIARDKATTMGHIKRGHLEEAAVRIPPPERLRELDSALTPLDDAIGSMAAESRKLLELRRLIIPRLVTGRLPLAAAADASPDVELVASGTA
jgi:type I restriction enzyme S subunit